MNRRGFFGILGGAFAAATDPERLLWTPGQRLISIPRPQGNQVLTPQMITEELLRRFQQNLEGARRSELLFKVTVHHPMRRLIERSAGSWMG